MVTVSPGDFKLRIPSFKAVDDATLELFLKEASGEIDTSWSEGDQILGIMYLAAHKMTGEGIGGSAEAQFGTFKRLKIGSLELERVTTATIAAPGSLSATSYGSKYLELLRANCGGIYVV